MFLIRFLFLFLLLIFLGSVVLAETTFFEGSDDFFIMGEAQNISEVVTNILDSGEIAGVGGGGSSCTYDPIYDWGCGEWSRCINEIQTRTCKETNNCRNNYGRPETERICAPVQLFDISFLLDDNLIQSSEELSVVVAFENFGVESTKVNLTFIILDETQNEIYKEEESITVITEEILRKSFEGLVLSEGKYIFVLHTLYGNNVFDEFKQEFEIGEGRKGIIGRAIDWVEGEGERYSILVGISILSIGLIWWLIKRRKKNKKKKA